MAVTAAHAQNQPDTPRQSPLGQGRDGGDRLAADGPRTLATITITGNLDTHLV